VAKPSHKCLGPERDRDAAPAAAGELEHGPDQAERRGLAGEAADHLRPPPDPDEGALEQVGAARLLAVLVGEAQMDNERVEVVLQLYLPEQANGQATLDEDAA